MKTRIIAIAALIAGLTFANAAEKVKAPNGGRIIDTVTPNAEFLVTKDKKVEVRFLDAAGKVVAPAAQTVTVTMGDRAAPTKLAFTKEGDKLVSDKTIPEGKDLPVVVQIKATPDAKSVTEKFNLNLAKCPTCENAEYACTCAHGGEEKGHEGHDHKPGEKH
jgi:hypothetical protein